MTVGYNREFPGLKKFNLSDVQKLSGKIIKSVLSFDSIKGGFEFALTEPSTRATTIVGLFNNLTPEDVDCFKVREEQYDLGIQWFIEMWKNGEILEGHTIHCKNIQGLPR